MGTICILLGLVLFIGSIFLGFAGADAFLSSTFAQTFVSFSTGSTQIVLVGVCAFIGFLICLNLVMLGLIYNKVSQSKKRK